MLNTAIMTWALQQVIMNILYYNSLLGVFGDICGLCFCCGWRVSTVIEFIWLLILGFWLSFGLWLSALDSRHILTLGNWLPSVFDTWFVTVLDSRYWPFSGFDSRLRTLGLVDSSATEKKADPFIEMGVIGVLSVCVSMRYAHSRLILTIGQILTSSKKLHKFVLFLMSSIEINKRHPVNWCKCSPHEKMLL